MPSPDGEQIAFTHWNDLTFPPSDIYTVEADGSGAPVNVTSSPGVVDLFPAWQPIPDED
jgi:Tol biopolymer transport system component